jgi:beta-mannanase
MAIVHWYALWGGWKAEFRRDDLEAVYRRGSVPMITWEPWAGTGADSAWSLRAAILSGRSDAYIESWARGLAAYGRLVLLRFAHEMHDQPNYPWAVGMVGNTADDYRAAWRHVRSIFARYNATNVQWVWNPNTVGDADASAYAPIYCALYPGDDQVDWIGLDVYNTGPSLDWGAPYWRPFAQILAPPVSGDHGRFGQAAPDRRAGLDRGRRPEGRLDR